MSEWSYIHPRGGSAKYLQRPLFDHYRDYIGDYARTVLEDGGQAAMSRSMEHLSDQVEVTPPASGVTCCKSGHPKVEQDGRTLYDRPPKAARLTEAGAEGQVPGHPAGAAGSRA